MVFDENTAPALASAMVRAVESGEMPPWPPSEAGFPLLGERRVLPNELSILKGWEQAGAAVGDPRDYVASSVAPIDPDARLRATAGYFPPPERQQLADDYRCFHLMAPPVLVRGYRWAVQDSTRRAAHHVAAWALTEKGAADVSALDGADGSPGWDCPMDAGVGVAGSMGTSGVGFVAPTWFSGGAAMEARRGFVVQVHYLPYLLREPDFPGLDLWVAESASALVRDWAFASPVELPCPLGIADPPHPCSRDRALRDTTPLLTMEQLRQNDDDVLASCGQSFDSLVQSVDWAQSGSPSKFVVETQCERPFPFSGRMLTAHVHAHTRAISAGVDVQMSDGSWAPILDIPRWRWVWEAAYSLATPLPLQVNQRVRLRCAFDNGIDNQWGVLGGPGRDGPAVPPLEPPAFRVSGPRRADEMCGVTLQWVPN